MTPDEVRRIRKRLGLTQSKFATLVGVHLVTIKKWETGAMGMRNTTEALIRLLSTHKRTTPKRGAS
jgi:DNA-binding transcriptional regulator YiaG